MQIAGLNKLTLLDYPGQIACIIFTQGCNFNCGYCHNAGLIPKCSGELSEDAVMDYLKKRQNILDGVVISGGEPLIQSGLEAFIKKIKALGFKVKLDTNGTNLKLLRNLTESGLLDYIALDIKADANAYPELIGQKGYAFQNVKEAIAMITKSGVDYEFRTTLVKEFHDQNTIINLCRLVGKGAKYYLQNFVLNESVTNQGLNGFTEEELKNLITKVNQEYPNVKVRGL